MYAVSRVHISLRSRRISSRAHARRPECRSPLGIPKRQNHALDIRPAESPSFSRSARRFWGPPLGGPSCDHRTYAQPSLCVRARDGGGARDQCLTWLWVGIAIPKHFVYTGIRIMLGTFESFYLKRYIYKSILDWICLKLIREHFTTYHIGSVEDLST